MPEWPLVTIADLPSCPRTCIFVVGHPGAANPIPIPADGALHRLDARAGWGSWPGPDACCKWPALPQRAVISKIAGFSHGFS